MNQSIYCAYTKTLVTKERKYTKPSAPLSYSPWAVSDQSKNKFCTEKHSGFLAIKQGWWSLRKEMIGALITILTFAHCVIFYKACIVHWFTSLIVLEKGQVKNYGPHFTTEETRAQGNCFAQHHLCSAAQLSLVMGIFYIYIVQYGPH